MFEEICLVCGKHLLDDGLAYCSEDCQSLDTSSPSISSASSALSSPNLGYATGGDVPALVPSALGSALNNYSHRNRNRNSMSSSSASSTSWSALSDQEDQEDAVVGVSGYRYSAFHDSADSLYAGSSKSANFAESMKPSALSYTRRPSGTNNHSTVPNLHKRTSSGHVRQIPRSAPMQSHMLSTDEDTDFGLSSRDESDVEYHSPKPVSSSKPKRSRASLPGYFSLLQMSSPVREKRASPVSSSSGNTIARPSPPTPKLPLVGLVVGASSTAIYATPRGRRRAHEESSRSSRTSSSRSESRSRRPAPRFSPRPHGTRTHHIDDNISNFSPVSSLARGRATVRRNSSPPPKMLLSAVALEDHNRACAVATRTEPAPFRKTRGRAKPEAVVAAAPGFGNGRSGLLDRERTLGSRAPRVL